MRVAAMGTSLLLDGIHPLAVQDGRIRDGAVAEVYALGAMQSRSRSLSDISRGEQPSCVLRRAGRCPAAGRAAAALAPAGAAPPASLGPVPPSPDTPRRCVRPLGLPRSAPRPRRATAVPRGIAFPRGIGTP